MSSENRLLTSLKLRLDYFSGRAWWNERETGGAGVILRFERVRARRPGRFQPLRSGEITPRFLERTLRALKRWRYDVIAMDEVCRRAVIMPQRRRFVCLTFDGCCKDVIASAYPILSRHRVPFTVYVPTVFPDGLGEAWWLALERIIAREDRLSLMIDRTERHYAIRTIAEKNETYEFLTSWLRQLAPSDLTAAIQDLCKRYSVDLAELSRKASMDWTDLAQLAADPLVTIGAHTVNHVMLAKVPADAARCEMEESRTAIAPQSPREFAPHLSQRRAPAIAPRPRAPLRRRHRPVERFPPCGVGRVSRNTAGPFRTRRKTSPGGARRNPPSETSHRGGLRRAP